MNKQEKRKIVSFLEKHNFSVNVYEQDKNVLQFEIGDYTDYGEDGGFSIDADSIEQFKHELYDYMVNFDIDDDVELQLQMKGHPTARLCVENAEGKARELEKLDELANKELQ